MNAAFVRQILLFVLSSAAVSAWAAPEAWPTFRSPDFGFTIQYPDDLPFAPGWPLPPPQHSMLPICDPRTTVACFQYNGDAFDHTVIQALGVSINVLRDRKTENDCNEIYSRPTQTTMIHGTRFHYARVASAAAGSSASATYYRALYQGVCFEITLGTARSDIDAAQYEESGIQPLDKDELRRVHGEMERMLHTFAFAGPIQDGAAWNVYHDEGCGATFEYPEGAVVKIVIPYTPAGAASNGISCEQSFTHAGRTYTVAAKVNLNEAGGLNQWLLSNRFPGVDDVRMVLPGDGFGVYRDPLYACFFARDEAFVFTVSDATRTLQFGPRDAVFEHLLQSFRIS